MGDKNFLDHNIHAFAVSGASPRDWKASHLHTPTDTEMCSLRFPRKLLRSAIAPTPWAPKISNSKAPNR
jgi:hypothetical protein